MSSSFSSNAVSLPFPVFLNHFFLVLDSETYAAIESHPFLKKEFAPNETRTTRRTDISYTGLYFYGVHTYFEFFDVAKEQRRRIGDSGIAFGVEEEGAINLLQTRMEAPPVQLITRPLLTSENHEKQVDWFYSLAPENLSFASGISSWIMEYHPEFLTAWNPRQAESNQGITRLQAIKRYVAVLRYSPSRPIFQEVRAISLAVDPSTRDALSAMCRAFGYRSGIDGEALRFEGPEFQLRVVLESGLESGSARGIQQITLRVSRAPEPREFRFGKKSILKFNDDNTATWSF